MALTSEHTEKGTPSSIQVVDVNDADTAAQIIPESEEPLDPVVAAQLRRKIDWHIMPLMCLMYLMTFADKTTLGQSAVLGIMWTTFHLHLWRLSSDISTLDPVHISIRTSSTGWELSSTLVIWVFNIRKIWHSSDSPSGNGLALTSLYGPWRC